MTMLHVCLASAATLGVSAILTLLLVRVSHLGQLLATLGSMLACGAGLGASALALQRNVTSSLSLHWTLPAGAFHVGLDPISAFFLLVLFLVSLLTSIYGLGYVRAHAQQGLPDGQLSTNQLLIASMIMILLARDAILFLMAWEIMSVVSYLLVTTEHEREDVRRSGFIYLAASHLGTVCIFLSFAWLYRHTASLDFDVWQAKSAAASGFSNVAFLLALIGFGTKAGLWPLHIWLPLAHPAAPSPVSAMMSGVLIKMGIFGIVRSLTFLAPPPAWWGTLLIVLGILGGVVGILLALAQDDLKRLLAYSSIENIGIVVLGLGIGIMGQSQRQPTLAFFGFAGALLHVLNHALLKGLLFQIAGSVLLQTGQRSLNALGGLSKRMPITSTLFLIAALGICGLPPLNGFFGEWLIYAGALAGGSLIASRVALVAIVAWVALALIGGLALTCFIKAHSIAFLGVARSNAVHKAKEVSALLLVPMSGLVTICVLIGVLPKATLRLVAPAVLALTGGVQPPTAATEMGQSLSYVSLGVVGLVGGLLLIRAWLLRGRTVTRAPTWACGYPNVTPRMQYSAGSFAAPLLFNVGPLVGAQSHVNTTGGMFLSRASSEVLYRDVIAETLTLSFASKLKHVSARLRVLQQGRIQLYLLYLFGTLIVVLFWQLMQGK